jgi:hypothetical protein
VSKKTEYFVFARINRGDDLTHIGSVVADSDNLAKLYAKYTYDEEDWFEMFVVQKENFLKIALVDQVLNYESSVLGGEAQ